VDWARLRSASNTSRLPVRHAQAENFHKTVVFINSRDLVK